MSCRLDTPVNAAELDCQRIYSRKERRLQYLNCKDRLDTDIVMGFMAHSSHASVPEDLYYGILEAMMIDEDVRTEEIWQLERWLDEYSGV